MADYFARSFERSLHKSYSKPLQKIGLLPEATSPYTKLSILRYLRNWFAFWVLLALFALIGLTAYGVFVVVFTFSIHQIQKQHHALVHIYVSVTGKFVSEMCILLCVEMLFASVWLSPVIWAWNRRADRLNRKAALPPPVAAAAPGVWPPPPTVSAGDLPKV